VNTTLTPWHIGFEEAVMLTPTGRTVFTVIVMVLEVAGFSVIQEALDVMIQDIRSLSTRLAFV
jgi:hypothetical protein